jgi:hypothetical protein
MRSTRAAERLGLLQVILECLCWWNRWWCVQLCQSFAKAPGAFWDALADFAATARVTLRSAAAV